jgi:hypothetical protein
VERALNLETARSSSPVLASSTSPVEERIHCDVSGASTSLLRQPISAPVDQPRAFVRPWQTPLSLIYCSARVQTLVCSCQRNLSQLQTTSRPLTFSTLHSFCQSNESRNSERRRTSTLGSIDTNPVFSSEPPTTQP